MKPSPFLYALEFTLHALFAGTTRALVISFFPLMGLPFIWPGLYSEMAAAVLLVAYALLGLSLFAVSWVVARNLRFVATDKNVIVRFSFWGMTADALSVAIEAVERIEIRVYGTAYGSVYLNSPIQLAHGGVTRGCAPLVQRSNASWRSMNSWRRLFGFYGFKGFDEFANIIAGQRKSFSNASGLMPVPDFLVR